jgi:hypothetical protein
MKRIILLIIVAPILASCRSLDIYQSKKILTRCCRILRISVGSIMTAIISKSEEHLYIFFEIVIVFCLKKDL